METEWTYQSGRKCVSEDEWMSKKRAKSHISAEVNDRVIKNTGYRAKRLLYILVIILLAGLRSLAATDVLFLTLVSSSLRGDPDPNLLYPETFLIARATLDTDVCCYAGIAEILYVDQSATNGGNTGLNWQNAFLELRDALDYARTSICGTVHSIYVAQGPYSPGDNTWHTFEIPDGVAVYGGFPKGGSELWQRNPGRYQAVLTGTVSGSP